MTRIPVAMLAMLLMFASACSGDDDPGSRAEACPTPSPFSDLSALPADIDLARYGTITRVTKRPSSVGASAVSRTTIVELYPPLARHVLESYDIIASENEGFEAEIFFERGPITGAFWLREGPCEGDVTIKLLHAKEKEKTG